MSYIESINAVAALVGALALVGGIAALGAYLFNVVRVSR